MQHQFHPVANVFPLMLESELAELAADIAANGLREPIWLDSDGKVIDGRNRYLACQRAEIEPMFRTYDGDDLIGFVVSLNLKRRHLSESQRAMVAAQIATLPKGNPTLSRPNAEISTFAPTVRQAAQLLNVSPASVTNARKVMQKGTSEEIEAVKAGEIAVGTLARDIRKGVPPEQRDRGIGLKVVNDRGRRMPEKPLAICMDRGLDQLDNTIDGLAKLAARPDAEDHPDLPDWIARLEKSRAAISRMINESRKRSAA